MTSDKRHAGIFSSSRHLSREELVRYSRHELNPEEQHIMETHLVDCELCSDALKGISGMQNVSALYEISKELHMRARKKHLLKKRIFSTYELITIFAVVFLILFLIIVSIFFFRKENRKQIPQETKTELRE